MKETFPKILILCFLCSYFLFGLYSRTVPGGEWYPFFSWFLFTEVPSPTQKDHAIRFLRVDGKELDPPLFFWEAEEILSPENHSSTEYLGIIRMIGESYARQDERATESQRLILEQSFLVHPVTYELVQITFDPIQRWKEGTILQTDPVKTFTSQ